VLLEDHFAEGEVVTSAPPPNLIARIRDNHRFLERKLIEHGAVLFHDFEVDSVERFQVISAAVHSEFVEY
jgi:hypothetical protein